MTPALILIGLSSLFTLGYATLVARRVSKLEALEAWRQDRRKSAIATADRAQEWAWKGLPVDDRAE